MYRNRDDSMEGSLRRLRPVNPPATLGENDVARRVALDHALDAIQIDVPAEDSERIILLNSLLGDIADAYLYAHKNITDEYQRLAAASRRILADDLRRAAR
jgi:hypothetical protein